MEPHPPSEALQRFGAGLLKPTEMATVAIHVARCSDCRSKVDHDGNDAARPKASGGYGAVFRQVARKARNRSVRLERDLRRAAHALDHLLALPRDEWNRVVRSTPRLQSYGLARRALDTCRAGWSDDPYLSERLAELALFVAERLPHSQHGKRNLNDLRAEAWASIGNCRRIRSDLLAVPSAFEASLELLRAGTGNEHDRGRMLSFMTSYLWETRDLEASLDLVSELDALSRDLGDSHLRGLNLWTLSRLQRHSGSVDEAIGTKLRARRLLDDRREPGCVARLNISLAYATVYSADPRGALARLDAVRPKALRQMAALERLRVDWTRALAYERLGDLAGATRLLEACRSGFIGRRIPYDVGLLDLELGRAHLELGEPTRARDLAAEAFPIFALRGIEPKTVAALDLFRQAGGLG